MPQVPQVHPHSDAFKSLQARLPLGQSDFPNNHVAISTTSHAAPSMVARQTRGGLPPRILRRVREHIDANLEKNVCLQELASLADLSKYHFARAFKQSTGAPPHSYLIKRRVERALVLLSETNMPLAEIALASGFSNQSHFTCRFREQIGMTPSMYRWNLG